MIRIKLFIICAVAAVSASAQMAMPDSSAINGAEAQPGPDSTPQKIVGEHNTPSESYKAERNAIRKGNKLYNKEKYHQALEEYDKALKVNEGSIRARYNKAAALLQLQSDDNKGTQNDPRVLAAQIFQDVIDDAKKYDPDIAEKSYYNLGNMSYNDEQYDQSIELYKASLRINPDNLQTRENLRLAQLKKQEQEQNQDQNQDQKDQEQQQQQQEQQQQQDQQQQDQQQEQQQQPMTQSAQQILQSMQNKENATRKKVKEEEQPAGGRPQTDKPW